MARVPRSWNAASASSSALTGIVRVMGTEACNSVTATLCQLGISFILTAPPVTVVGDKRFPPDVSALNTGLCRGLRFVHYVYNLKGLCYQNFQAMLNRTAYSVSKKKKTKIKQYFFYDVWW